MNDLIIGVVSSLVSLISIIITSIRTNSLVKYRVGELEKNQEKLQTSLPKLNAWLQTDIRKLPYLVKT